MRTVPTVLAALVIAIAAHAQSSRPQFEVASVKTNNSGSFSSRSSSDSGSGYFRASNATLKSLILSCYRLFDFQLVGGPDWIGTARFDIEARVDMSAMPLPKTPAGQPDPMSLMIRSLLEDRFQLRSHRETRELPIFTLVSGKDGPKLQPTIEGHPGPGGLAAGSARTNGTSAGVEMSGSGITMERLINMLSSQAGRPIIDKTNLTGTYDFSLKFTPVANTAAPAGADSAEPAGPSLFTALQEELGLKLESARGPVEVLVIESVRMPTEN